MNAVTELTDAGAGSSAETSLLRPMGSPWTLGSDMVPMRMGGRFAHILVALDGSSYAEEALPYVVMLAGACGSQVTLLTAAPATNSVFMGSGRLALSAAGVRAGEASSIDEPARSAARYMRSVGTQLAAAGVEADWECTPGERPADVIVDRAHALGADLLVLTSHGRGRSRHGVFGGIAEEVLRRAPCPVLLLHAHGP